MSAPRGTSSLFSVFNSASRIDTHYVVAVNATMAPGLRLMNATCLSASRNRGEIVASFELDEKFVNDEGFVCAGFFAHILEQTASGAASLVTGKSPPSVEFKTSLIAAARPGKFIATGCVLRAGALIVFTEAKVFDCEKHLIATATVTCQLLSPARLVERLIDE